MNAPHGSRAASFFAALHNKDDALALRVIDDIISQSSNPLCASSSILAMELLKSAVIRNRPNVVSYIVHHLSEYTNLDTLGGTGLDRLPVDEISAVGLSIITGVPMLALCVELGGDLSTVCRQGIYLGGEIFLMKISAVHWSIRNLKADCLDYLLGDEFPSALTNFAHLTMGGMALVEVVSNGSAAIPIFKVLMKHRVNLRSLGTAPIMPPGAKGPEDIAGRLADVILLQAREGGDTELVRFLVKEVGLQGNTECAKVMLSDASNLAGMSSPEHGQIRREKLQEELTKPDGKTYVGSIYMCSTCNTTCITKLCSSCRESRYCSVACQRRDWQNGHKEICSRRGDGPSDGRPLSDQKNVCKALQRQVTEF